MIIDELYERLVDKTGDATAAEIAEGCCVMTGASAGPALEAPGLPFPQRRPVGRC